MKGTLIGERQVGDSCEIWVEFRPMKEQDSLEYLNMVFVKEPEGWKISSYGLEP